MKFSFLLLGVSLLGSLSAMAEEHPVLVCSTGVHYERIHIPVSKGTDDSLHAHGLGYIVDNYATANLVCNGYADPKSSKIACVGMVFGQAQSVVQILVKGPENDRKIEFKSLTGNSLPLISIKEKWNCQLEKEIIPE